MRKVVAFFPFHFDGMKQFESVVTLSLSTLLFRYSTKLNCQFSAPSENDHNKYNFSFLIYTCIHDLNMIRFWRRKN